MIDLTRQQQRRFANTAFKPTAGDNTTIRAALFSVFSNKIDKSRKAFVRASLIRSWQEKVVKL
jgi:hypothetical protein